MSGRGKVPTSKNARMSKSSKAGLIFPAARVHRFLKARRVADRVSSGAGVYLAAVLEYLSAEVLELSGNCAKDMKKTRIIPRHILLALKSDSEFDEMMTKHNVTIAQGGVPPHIMVQLLPKKADHSSANDDDVTPTPKTPSQAAKKPKKVKPAAPENDDDNDDDADADADAAAAPAAKAKKVTRTGTVESLGSKRLFLGQNLKIVKANIGKYDKADAVVHPTNAHLSTSGMVGSELVKYGGAALQAEMSSQGASLGVTQCCITGGGDLPAKYVIHCNSPSWGSNAITSIAQLKQAIENILKLADKQNLKSVALPSIGSGNNGYPKDEAARAILQAIDAYFQSIMSSSLKEVHFVLFDDESLNVYNTVYSHEFP